MLFTHKKEAVKIPLQFIKNLYVFVICKYIVLSLRSRCKNYALGSVFSNFIYIDNFNIYLHKDGSKLNLEACRGI